MSGQSWADPQTLTLGNNTFAFADVTEPGVDKPYNHAWWVFTPPSTQLYYLDTYLTEGSDPAAIDTVIAVFDDASDPGSYVEADALTFNDDTTDTVPGQPYVSRLDITLTGGTTYHLLVGTFDPEGDTITTYVLRASLTPPDPDPSDDVPPLSVVVADTGRRRFW